MITPVYRMIAGAEKEDDMDHNEARKTAKVNVLNTMAWARLNGYIVLDGHTYPCKDGWIPGTLMAMLSFGGGEDAKRRMRNLKEDGWIIEKRKKLDSASFEYRLFCTQHEAKRIVYSYFGSVTPKMIYGDTSRQLGMFQ